MAKAKLHCCERYPHLYRRLLHSREKKALSSLALSSFPFFAMLFVTARSATRTTYPSLTSGTASGTATARPTQLQAQRKFLRTVRKEREIALHRDRPCNQRLVSLSIRSCRKARPNRTDKTGAVGFNLLCVCVVPHCAILLLQTFM